MSNKLVLRNVVNDDLPIFFEYQLDPEANYMAAFHCERSDQPGSLYGTLAQNFGR